MSPMQLTLYVPGLLLPAAILPDSVFDIRASALSLLLGRGRRAERAPDWLAWAFGLASPLPAAALRQADPAPGPWLCLDPVHFDVSREGILLADPAGLRLEDAEAAALRAAMAPLFADLGELVASAPGRWELHLNREPDLATRPLAEALGQPVDPGLPGGADGRELRRRLAEAQTVLHAHPVNRDREGLGQPTVSSLWPWGQGSLPTAVRSDFSVVWSADPVHAGLCALAGLPCLMPPGRFQPASGRVLAIDERLAPPARAQDVLRWRAALLALERDWIAPAVAALKEGSCTELSLVGTRLHGAPAAVEFNLRRGDRWRFWQRPRPLTALA